MHVLYIQSPVSTKAHTLLSVQGVFAECGISGEKQIRACPGQPGLVLLWRTFCSSTDFTLVRGGGVTAIGIVRPVVRPCRAAASLNPQRLFLLATHSAHCSLVVFLPLVLLTFKSGASQVVQAVKNPPANAGDTGDTGSVPGWGRSSGERPWQPTPAFLPGKSPRRSVEWQRVEHN